MDFPHLSGDTSFPGVQNVNPYRFKNTFDYHRWDAGTVLKLCNVNWSEDDGNVVKFKDDAARDEYFDSIPGDSQKLESQARIMSDSSVKVPLPFDECSKYNYLMVDIKTATSDTNPIDYETLRHMSRFYFFVLDYEEIAPNTTQLYLSIDYWTTYINRIKIGNMILERGHAPMKAAADVDTYLANPIANTDNLLVEDVDYGKGRLTKHGDFIPFGSGEKYVLMASTINPSMAEALPAATYDLEGNISFADDAASEDIVKGSGKDAGLTTKYASTGLITTPQMSAATSMTADDDYIFNGYTIYAFSARGLKRSGASKLFPKDLYPSNATLIDYLAWKYPQFAESIAAMYIVTKDMFTAGKSVMIGGDDKLIAQVATGTKNTLFNLKLDKSMFGYEKPYSDITKLYTSPYAVIEITDAYGNKKEIGTERISNMAVRNRVSIAYPVLKFEAFLTGIDSDQNGIQYEWFNLSGDRLTKVINNDSFRDFSYWYDIPTFELFMSGYVHHALHSYNAENTVPQREDEISYGNAARSANVALNNALRSAKAGFDNANGSANVGYKNADASALAAYLNAQASAATTLSNANKNADVALTNTEASADMSLQNETASAGTSQDNANASAATALGNATRSTTASKSNADASAKTNLENETRSAVNARVITKRSADTVMNNGYRSTVAESQIARANANAAYNNEFTYAATAKHAIALNVAHNKWLNSSRTAVTNFNNSNASADTAQTNSNDSAGNTLTNSNADAQLSYDNAVRSANTAQKNANASADTAYSNTVNTNTAQTKNTATKVANSLANINAGNSTAKEKTKDCNGLMQANQAWDAGYSRQMQDLENVKTSVAGVTSGLTNSLPSMISGGSLGGMYGALASFAGEAVNTLVTIGVGEAQTEAGITNSQMKVNEASKNANNIVNANTDLASTTNTNSSEAATSITKNNVDTSNTNASNTQTTTKANASRDKDTNVANAAASMSTTNANAQRDKTTAVTINNRTHDTAKNNISRTYELLMGKNSGGVPEKGGNIQNDYDTEVSVADRNLQTSENIANTKKTTSLNNNEYSVDAKNANLKDTNTTSNTNADTVYTTSIDNINASNTTTVANNKRNYDASIDNATDTNTTTLANIKRSYDTTISNATNSNTVTKDNAGRANTNAKEVAAANNATALANAKRTYDAAIGNAGNTWDNSKAVAKRSNDAAVTNANDSHAISIYNEQQVMQKNQDIKRLTNYDKRLDTPYAISHAYGQADSDEFAWRGLSIQIKTERPSEYKRAGDMFLRYGYALHRNWDVKDLNVMQHFTYWKAEDVWLIGGVGVMEAAQQAIRDKMLEGITVWSNPDEVGSVSIYENN